MLELTFVVYLILNTGTEATEMNLLVGDIASIAGALIALLVMSLIPAFLVYKIMSPSRNKEASDSVWKFIAVWVIISFVCWLLTNLSP